MKKLLFLNTQKAVMIIGSSYFPFKLTHNPLDGMDI